jgi:hypothetical protein
MITLGVYIKVANDQLKLTPAISYMDTVGSKTKPILTDGNEIDLFELPPSVGKILV